MNFLRIDTITKPRVYYVIAIGAFVGVTIASWVVDNSGLGAQDIVRNAFARRVAEVCVNVVFAYTVMLLVSKACTYYDKVKA